MMLFRWNRKALLMVVGVQLFYTSVQAAEDGVRSYKIRSGMAEETLKIAAEQGRMELVYSPEIVVGIRTQALKGKYPAQQALEQMLEHTPLVVVPVSEGKAFGIIMSSEDEGPGLLIPEPSAKIETTLTSQTDMNLLNKANTTRQNNWLKTLTAVLTIGIVGGQDQLAAQEADEENKVYDLSPFTVDATEDTGYVATAT
ncbi:MAG: STN domain-containing protein, partial [Verrucomicrobia bacterium]|nr:STN domain-containing protein [Verrucomicrobiota bacterium]